MRARRRARQLAAPPPPAAAPEAVAQRARDYAQEARAPNTRRAYRDDWRDFTAWCAARGLPALPAAPETVALSLTDLAGRCKTSTLQHRLSSISQAHQLAGHAAHGSPTRHATVRAVWAGIRRAKGTAQAGKAPALTADVRAMVATLPDTLLGLRDRALLRLGFAGAFRRGELVGLDVGDLEAGRAGLVVTLRRSKTDQEGEGRKLGVPYGARPVGVARVRLQHPLAVALVRNEQPVEARLAPRAHPPRGHGVGPRRPEGDAARPDALGGEHGVERGGKPGVEISGEHAGAPRGVLEVPPQRARLLGDPGGRRVGRAPGDEPAPGLHLQD